MKKLIFIGAIIFTISSNAQDTVKMENLKSIKGLSYKQNSKIPFTGLVAKYYANGKIFSLTNFSNGLKSGIVQIFYDSGKPRIITYENEKSINYGETKVWNENGSLAFEGNWINGNLSKRMRQIHILAKLSLITVVVKLMKLLNSLMVGGMVNKLFMTEMEIF